MAIIRCEKNVNQLKPTQIKIQKNQYLVTINGTDKSLLVAFVCPNTKN